MDERIMTHADRVLQVKRTKGGFGRKGRALFLSRLAETCNVRLSARFAGVSHGHVYHVRRTDQAFAELWRQALEMGYERLEEALLSRALVGVNAIALTGEEDGSERVDGDGSDETPVEGAEAVAGPAIGATTPGRRSATPKGSGLLPCTGLSASRALGMDVQIAMWRLNRHRGGSGDVGRPTPGRPRRVATQEETDAAIERKLALLAKRLKSVE